MPEWLIILCAFWFVFGGFGRGRSCGWRPRLDRGRERTRLPSSTTTPRVQTRPTLETVEAELRRRYVAGEITVEQYEHELDRHYRR